MNPINFLNIFKAPEAYRRVERVIQLVTERGTWIRLGTWMLGGVFILVGVMILLRRPIANAGMAAATGGASAAVKAVA